ncbi:hypothetical protein HOLleu_24076 [Holothuria leucospilota]|uniref:Uncharacterized protein n=1 Tax=Holothuria leucospilota TaxID=206669 RepID=A0A9Q1H5M6_HOLLE|nr:hypothetical protein HOLleu_24076 [Holothuria leucospilota]
MYKSVRRPRKVQNDYSMKQPELRFIYRDFLVEEYICGYPHPVIKAHEAENELGLSDVFNKGKDRTWVSVM